MRKNIFKKVLLGLLIVLIILIGGYLRFPMETISLLITGNFGLYDIEAVNLPEGAQWFDDYYSIEYIDEKTVAIGEPRYWQENYSYLIIGEDKALLFDTGPGNRDIMEVVNELTDMPVTIMCSHFHFDHIGHFNKYDNIVLAETQLNSDTNSDNSFKVSNLDFVFGQLEGRDVPTIYYNDVVKIGDVIDLGERNLAVLFTPGHSDKSISLYDDQSNMLFTGDFLYVGPLMVQSVPVYRKTTKKLIETINEETIILGGHSQYWSSPVLGKHDLIELYSYLDLIESEVIKGKTQINKEISIMPNPF